MTHILLITGLSDAGKDSVALRLGLPIVKFAAPMKRTFEDYLQLPQGALDDKEFRLQKVRCPISGKPLNYSYLDLMIKAYRAWDNIEPGLSLPKVKSVIDQHATVAITDCRKVVEARFLMHNYPLITHVRVVGRGIRLESDDNFELISALIPADVTITNDTTLGYFEWCVDKFVKPLLSF
jgi:hypothetical protein